MTVSSDEPDWSREAKRFFEWNPGRSLLASIRSYEHYTGSGPARRFMRILAVLRHRFWSAVTGADIPLGCRLGGGLLIPHPNGIVIHPDANIGPNCLIFQQVTIGTDGCGIPELGGHVDVGAGAKILGGVKIGADARIGANAVVLGDVPEGCIAIGVPTTIRQPSSRRQLGS